MTDDARIYSIAKFLTYQSGCGWVLGVNLFAGYLPDKRADNTPPPTRCVVVAERTPGDTVPDLPDWEEKAIQIWNRADGYYTASQDAWCLYTALHGTAGWTLPAILGMPSQHCMVINAVGTPAPIANPNPEGYFEFSTNYIWSIANAP